MAEVVGSAGPQLSSVALTFVVHEEERVVLAAGHLPDVDVLEGVCNLGWLNDTVAVGIAESKLALIRVAAAKDFILIGHEDRVAAAGLQILDTLAIEGFLRDRLGCKHVLQAAVLTGTHSQGPVEGLAPGPGLTIFAEGK